MRKKQKQSKPHPLPTKEKLYGSTSEWGVALYLDPKYLLKALLDEIRRTE